MKTFKEYIKEHPNLRTRIIKAINPMDKLRDKMDDLKKLPGKVKDRAVWLAATIKSRSIVTV